MAILDDSYELGKYTGHRWSELTLIPRNTKFNHALVLGGGYHSPCHTWNPDWNLTCSWSTVSGEPVSDHFPAPRHSSRNNIVGSYNDVHTVFLICGTGAIRMWKTNGNLCIYQLLTHPWKEIKSNIIFHKCCWISMLLNSIKNVEPKWEE